MKTPRIILEQMRKESLKMGDRFSLDKIREFTAKLLKAYRRGPNGSGPKARRLRQIENGMLKVS